MSEIVRSKIPFSPVMEKAKVVIVLTATFSITEGNSLSRSYLPLAL